MVERVECPRVLGLLLLLGRLAPRRRAADRRGRAGGSSSRDGAEKGRPVQEGERLRAASGPAACWLLTWAVSRSRS